MPAVEYLLSVCFSINNRITYQAMERYCRHFGNALTLPASEGNPHNAIIMKLDLVFFGDEMLISKLTTDWRAWQSKLLYYKASLTFKDIMELLAYLKADYNLSFDDIKTIESMLSDISIKGVFIGINENGINKLNLEQTKLDIFDHPGEIAYWRDGEWILHKQNTNIYLRIYFKGHKLTTKEIKLNTDESKKLLSNGKIYAETLVTNLQNINSTE